jgi:hypothetical protein
LEQRTFAGAILAYDAERLARVNLEADIADGPEVTMEGDTIQAGKFFEARTGSRVYGIAFGNVSKLYNRRRHLLESTGGKKACQLGTGRPPTPVCHPQHFEIAV